MPATKNVQPDAISGVSEARTGNYRSLRGYLSEVRGLAKINRFFNYDPTYPGYRTLEGRPGKHHGMQAGNPNRKRKLVKAARKRNRG